MEDLKGLGINYPIKIGNQGPFQQTFFSLENERVKIIMLLNTIEGERFMQPTFGLNLHKFIFDPITSILKGQIEEHIKSKIKYWLPNVEILDLKINVTDNIDRNYISGQLTFGLKNSDYNYDVITFNY